MEDVIHDIAGLMAYNPWRDMAHRTAGCVYLMKRPYLPELIDCLTNTIHTLEQSPDKDNPQVQNLRSRILLILADLKRSDSDENGESAA